MANYTIRLTHIIDSINSTKSKGTSEGFLFKYNNTVHLISVHHFKPIIQTIIGSSDKSILRHKNHILWNELQIFSEPDEKYTLNTKIIKTYRLRFNEPKTILNIYINNRKAQFASYGYNIVYHTPIQKSIYNQILLEEHFTKEMISKYKGLSGSPVCDDHENLVGIFSKIKVIDDKLYGYVLPVIYLIKSLDKTDNENLYYLNINDYDNLKIGKYEVLQNEDNIPTIYYHTINNKIPLDIFFSFEGDIDESIICKNLKSLQLKKYDFQKYDNFDISQKIIKKDDTFKLNTGLLTYLISNGMDSQYQKIINEYISKNIVISDIWIRFNNEISVLD
jgi:hypothetical protein